MARVVVTGGAGFVGSHLTDRLLQRGDEVVVIDNLLTGDLANLAHVRANPRFAFVEQDVTTEISLAGPVDAILHFASPASPIDYLELPIQTLKVGALGTHKALGLAKAKQARFLLASTSEVYGDPLVHPQTEDYWGNVNPIGPRGVYDEAKRFAEAMVMAYHRAHGVDTRIVRIFNTYGPRMRLNDGRVVPTFVGQALRGEDMTVFGDGSQTRSFCFVSDLVTGILRLLEVPFHDPVNIGNPAEMTVLQFAEKIRELTGSSSKIVRRPLPIDDPKVRQPDITRARQQLGWEPKVELADGLSETIAYFRTKLDFRAMSSDRDFYETLGVGRDASDRDLKQAYRKVALQYHPDRNPDDPSAEAKFKQAAEAYEVLSDPQKRQAYDRFGHDGVRGQGRGFQSSDDVFSSFGSIFEEFFGGGFGRRPGGPGGRERPGRGNDLRLDLTISFAEAATGVEKTVEVERLHECDACHGNGAKPGTQPVTCPTCQGRGQVARSQGFFSIATACPACRGEGVIVREKCTTCGGERRLPQRAKLTVKVPGGVDSGARLRMTGEGEGGQRGGPGGDLYIYLTVQPHERFRREENDVILDQPISITQAALGGRIDVPTLSGPAEVKIPAGTQHGDTVSLRGKGFPNLRGFGSGAQRVEFQIQVPKKLSRRQKELLQELAKAMDEEV